MKTWVYASNMLIATLLNPLSGCGSSAGGAAGGAAGSGGGTTAEPPWTAPFGGSRECFATKTECSSSYQTCESRCVWEAINNPSYDCSGVCSDSWPCLGGVSGEECALHSYNFAGGPPLMDLEAACDSAVARDKSCGTHAIYDNCKTLAIIGSPDVIPNYECVAQTPCGASLAGCFVPEDRALENEICDEVGRYCSAFACTPTARAMLRSFDRAFRADTSRAAQLCLEEKSCRDITNCLEAWQHTVFAGSASFLFFGVD